MLVKNINSRLFFRSLLSGVLNITLNLIRNKKNRYIIITPTVFSRQIIFDKKYKNFNTIYVRNEIDSGTLNQIYGSEDYAIDNLIRCDDLKSFYLQNIRAGRKPLIIDCGANIGVSSKYFSENFKDAKIVGIEPDSSNIKQAKKNNPDPNVDFIEAAIGSESGVGEIFDPGLGNNAYRIVHSGSGTKNIISVNEVLLRYTKNKFVPFIIKIDIEGFEEDLFRRNLEWIKLFPLLIIELHDWMLPRQNTSKNFLKAISDLDRDFVYLGENIFSISNTFSLEGI